MDSFLANWASLQPLQSTIRFTIRISYETGQSGVELGRRLAADDGKGSHAAIEGFGKLFNWYMPFFCVEGRSPPYGGGLFSFDLSAELS